MLLILVEVGGVAKIISHKLSIVKLLVSLFSVFTVVVLLAEVATVFGVLILSLHSGCPCLSRK